MKTIWLKATCSGDAGSTAPTPRAAASRTLVSNGRWVVPAEERPEGWQSLSVSEAHEDGPAAETEVASGQEVAQ